MREDVREIERQLFTGKIEPVCEICGYRAKHNLNGVVSVGKDGIIRCKVCIQKNKRRTGRG